MNINFTIVKEWRAFETDEFVDGEDIYTFVADKENMMRKDASAKLIATCLNKTEAVCWEALPNEWEYTSFSIRIDGGNSYSVDFIEAEDLGLVKENIRRTV